MPTRRIFEIIPKLPKTFFWSLYAIAGLAAVVSFAISAWVGGHAAKVAGGIQFISVVLVAFVVAIVVLFSSYGSRANTVLNSWPVVLVKILVADVFGLLCAYAIAFTVWRIATGRL